MRGLHARYGSMGRMAPSRRALWPWLHVRQRSTIEVLWGLRCFRPAKREGSAPMLRRTAMLWMLAGIGILLVPIALLLLLAAGEAMGGDPGGLVRLLLAAPLVILALLAWRFPAACGRFLLGV